MSDVPIPLTILVKRELFRFESHAHWVAKGQSWFAKCGVPKGLYIAIDAKGHVMHMGKCFSRAKLQDSYPVIVYELKTNWPVPTAEPVEATPEGLI